jgi:hypothetical protein
MPKESALRGGLALTGGTRMDALQAKRKFATRPLRPVEVNIGKLSGG